MVPHRLTVSGPALAIALAVALALAGCGGAKPHPGSAAPPTATRPAKARAPKDTSGAAQPSPTVAPGGARSRPGYDHPAGSLAGLDLSPLAGRRIVIDPGHGGRFPGSIGPTGVTEAEVNLGVALHLWGMLTDAGAQVLLTRTTDRDLTTATDSSLKGDLAARVERTRAFDPDVFVSIHHNADLSGRRDLNETQTYWKLADPLASLELAQSVHARLVSGLDVGADRLVPGNYFVVRNAPCPAMLGESSYLTNPDVESRLALASRQRIEATAYFLGLLDYFRRGVPRITASGTAPGDATAPADADAARERPLLTATTDLEPGTVRLVVDGALVDTARVVRTPIAFLVAHAPAWALRWQPEAPLTDGRHTVEWTVEAAGGAWSRTRVDSFAVHLPAARVAFTLTPDSAVAKSGQLVGLAVRLLDRHGRALADTVVARFGATVGARMVDSLDAHAAARVVPGEARAYARLTGGSIAAFTYAIARPALPPGLASGQARLTVAHEGARAPRVRTGFVRAATPAGANGVGGALVRGPSPADTARANADGFFAIAADSLSAAAPGYVTATAPGKGDDLALVALGDGALIGRRIVVDAAGGGADTTRHATPDTSAAADSLTRVREFEADANLRVARALAADLRAAGAVVLLTRDTPDSLASIDRLRASEGFAADRVLTISHRAAPGTALAGHYFASAAGKALAQHVAAWLESRGIVRTAPVAATPGYLVQQTGSIAASVDLPDAAALDLDPTHGAARLDTEAYALYLALLEDAGADPAHLVPLDVKVARGGAPAAGVPVELDGRWILSTDAAGAVRFDGLPAGATVTVAAGPGVAPGGPGPVMRRVALPAPHGVTLALAP